MLHLLSGGDKGSHARITCVLKSLAQTEDFVNRLRLHDRKVEGVLRYALNKMFDLFNFDHIGVSTVAQSNIGRVRFVGQLNSIR